MKNTKRPRWWARLYRSGRRFYGEHPEELPNMAMSIISLVVSSAVLAVVILSQRLEP